MSRQAVAVARLAQSRQRLRLALVDASGLGTAQAMLGRVVQQHPLTAAALALLVGGWLAQARPWRGWLKPALWSALLPPLMAALATAPLSGWADVLAALLRQAASPAKPAPP